MRIPAADIKRLLVIVLSGLIVGWMLGHLGWGLAVALALVLFLVWRDMQRILHWLKTGKRSDIPELDGLAGNLVDLIADVQQRNRKRKKRLSSMLKRFQQSTAAMPDATIVLTENAEIEWLNQAAKDMFGLSSKDAGQRITNLIRHPRFVEYLQSRDFTESIEINSPLAEDVTLNLRLTSYGRNQMLLTARDITRLHQLQKVRQDFVANVSHELRTPLTVLAGYLETLYDFGDELDPGLHHIIGQMQQQTGRMSRIVNDLLLLSRLETTPNDQDLYEPVSVPAMVATIAEDCRLLSAGQHHQIKTEVDDKLWMLGSPKELQSAFSNLAFNAVKYTPEDGVITLRWFSTEKEFIYEVEDTGIGIESHHIPRLTERFYRVDVGRSREKGGTGLGLAIVKHVVNRHGGYMDIDSEPGKGSIFRCHFPRISRQED